MSSLRLTHRIAALAVTAVAVLGLTACSGLPLGSAGSDAPTASASRSASAEPVAPGEGDSSGDSGQSVADACTLVQDTITAATAEFENVSAEDPSAVVAAMDAAAQSIADAATQVTNDEVAALLPSLQGMFEQVAGVMQAIVDGDVSKLGELEALGTQFQETSRQFQDLCAP